MLHIWYNKANSTPIFIYTLIPFGVPNPPTTKGNKMPRVGSGDKVWREPTATTRGKKRENGLGYE